MGDILGNVCEHIAFISSPMGDVERSRERDQLIEVIAKKRWLELGKGSQRTLLRNIVFCAIDCERWRRLKDYMRALDANWRVKGAEKPIKNSGGYLMDFVKETAQSRGMTYTELSEEAYQLGIGKRLIPLAKRFGYQIEETAAGVPAK